MRDRSKLIAMPFAVMHKKIYPPKNKTSACGLLPSPHVHLLSHKREREEIKYSGGIVVRVFLQSFQSLDFSQRM
jgi:hypothetical protein